MNLSIGDAKFLFYSFFMRAMTVSVHDVIYNLVIRFLGDKFQEALAKVKICGSMLYMLILVYLEPLVLENTFRRIINLGSTWHISCIL